MTEDKIEAAAKAMFERQRQKLTVPLEWRELSPQAQEGYRADARVAFDVFFPAGSFTSVTH